MQVPPLYRKFYCYIHSPEQTNTKNDRHALEKEVLHVLLERRSSSSTTAASAKKNESEGEEDLGFAAYFPEHADLYASVERRFDELGARVQATYDRIVAEEQNEDDDGDHDEREKAFAKRVAGEEWKGLMFRMRRNGTTAHHVLLQSVPRNVYAWLSEKD
jgi:hypothetical protein